MSKNDINKTDNLENVESALSRAELFIEKHQKNLSIALIAVVLIIGGYWGYKKLVVLPKNEKAQKEIFNAQFYFEKDSFRLALNGDGINPGFNDIIKKYGSTKAGQLANYYAGVCNLNLGKFNEAIKNLESFDAEDELINANAKGLVGDAYLELGNKEKALSAYEDAVDADNEFTAPTYLLKMGILLETMNKKEDALKAYQTIKDKYSQSIEARQIDKYIGHAQAQ